MTDINYTPGKWEVIDRPCECDKRSDYFIAVKEYHDENVVLRPRIAWLYDNGESTRFNANLIAAAPEMFELLRDIGNSEIVCKECAFHGNDEDDICDVNCPIKRIIPLLRKAQGK